MVQRLRYDEGRVPGTLMLFERITINPQQMGGVPCIRGLQSVVPNVPGVVSRLA